MHRRATRIALLLALLTLAPAARLSAAPRCFAGTPGIADCIDGRIRAFWEKNGGLPAFGFPISPASQRDAPGGPVTGQLFERARIEVHPGNRPPYDVELGRLGAELLERRGEPPAAREQPREGCAFFSETGQNVCPPFLAAWRRFGLDLGQPGVSRAESLALIGLPLGPARQEQLPDGSSATVQWFERARLEDRGAQGVMLGLLGREAGIGATAASPAPAQQAAPPAASAPGERGGFIQVSGSQLTRLGRPVQLKGVNYYPQGRPWGEMWQYWDAQQAERELRQARDDLGINVVRILLPYDTRSPGGPGGEVTPAALRQLREIVQVAGSLDMRVVVSLFDFYDGFPAAGTPEEAQDLAYLETLLGNFVGDDRIAAWDIHNEPDNYATWKAGGAPRVLSWLGRMADAVHRIAPNQLVTVGMGQYDNLYQPGPDGRRVVDYVDFVSLHNYNAADMRRQIAEVRARTGKPIVLGEFGWPTGPACVVRGYTEAQQADVYREALAQATGLVSGVVAWTLRDFDFTLSVRYDSREEHYGLYRADGSRKPAAESLRAYQAGPLPSAVTTDLELSSEGARGYGGGNGPLLVRATGHYVKGPFRRAWELLGGQGSFGAPIAEAFLRESPQGPQAVQYFEAGALVAPAELMLDPGAPVQLQVDVLRQNLRWEPLGRRYAGEAAAAAAEAFAPGRHGVGDVFADFYRGYRGQWRLGSAISEPFTMAVNGAPTTVQYFELGRLELGPGGNVEVGRLGARAYAELCQANGQ